MIVNNIIFLINMFWVFSTEYIVYKLFGNYPTFIDGLTRRLAKSNMLYVKIFQAITLNNNLIDDNINNKLLEFTDNAHWDIYDLDFDTLFKIVNKYDIELENKSILPKYSGMISLVYKGYLREKNNKPIIIKIKRKNIEKRLDYAIDNLLFLMWLLSFIPIVQKYQLTEVVTKNIEMIKHQTNFFEEVNNINLIGENCKKLKYIKIPYVYDSVTKEFNNIILMEYIDGLKINQIQECDYEGFARQIIKFGVVTSIIHGTTHGDLHSGNILFIKDNNDNEYPYKLGIIDFGIIYNLSQTYRETLFEVLTQIFDVPVKETAKKLLNSGIIEPKDIFMHLPNEHYKNILKITERIIEDTISSSKETNQIQIYKFLSNLRDYLFKKELMEYGIKPSNDFIKSQLVLAMAHGITLTLCKDKFLNLMDKVINELFHTDLFI